MFTAKYYNIDLPCTTRENIRRTENFKNYLCNNYFKFETSGNFDWLHFEIFVNSKNELDELNKMLDIIVFYDAIINRDI